MAKSTLKIALYDNSKSGFFPIPLALVTVKASGLAPVWKRTDMKGEALFEFPIDPGSDVFVSVTDAYIPTFSPDKTALLMVNKGSYKEIKDEPARTRDSSDLSKLIGMTPIPLRGLDPSKDGAQDGVAWVPILGVAAAIGLVGYVVYTRKTRR